MANENGEIMKAQDECKVKKSHQSVIIGFRITQAERAKLELILKESGTTISKHFRESVASLLNSQERN